MKFISYYFKSYSPAVSKFLVIIGLTLTVAACQWGDEVVSIVQPNPDDFTALYSDSSTVRTSTVALDSIVTGYTTRVFVGRFTDPYLGKMSSTSFFQPTMEASLSLPDEAVYDSLILSLRYDGYYYGDTTKLMNLAVHSLQKDISLESPFTYYNHDTTPYDAEPIGKARFFPNPRPRAGTPKKILNIKLSSVLGKKIFDLAKANLLTSNAEWINLIKGIAVIPGAADNNAVIGFSRDSAAIQLHYHTPLIEGVANDSSVFIANASYNQVVGDRSKTVLAKVTNRRIAVPSSQTGELNFIQAGTGIMTRVDFPTIRQLKYNKYTFANRAYLIITPYRLSITDQLRGPAAIYAYYADKNNEFFQGASDGYPQPLTDIGGAPVRADLINDLVNNIVYYRLDVSQYVIDILRSDSDEPAGGLLLRTDPFVTGNGQPSYPDLNSEFSKGFHRIVIGSQNNLTDRGMKLQVYYTTVKPQ